MMRAEDVTEALGLVLNAWGCDSATVLPKLRLHCDIDPRCTEGRLAEYIFPSSEPSSQPAAWISAVRGSLVVKGSAHWPPIATFLTSQPR